MNMATNPSTSLLSGRFAQVFLKYRRELVAVAIFSAVINVLMLAPTLYMLQVFDRVMSSRSELTLLVLTAIVLLFYAVQAFSEWFRARLLNGLGLSVDLMLNEPVFNATLRGRLLGTEQSPIQAFTDLTVARRWLTSQAVFAFFDLPWSPIYLAVMFLLHPYLGWVTVLFMAILGAFAWWSGRVSSALGDESEDEERELNAFVHAKLRNAEVIEVHGMMTHLRHRWWERQVSTLQVQAYAQDIGERLNVSSKEIRALMQSLALGVGALLAIEGQISYGAMIAASLLMGRATAPIDQLVSTWRSFLNVRKSLARVEDLLERTDQVPSAKVTDRQRHSASPVATLEGARISLEAVKFSVAGRPSPIVRGVTADFEPGRIYVVMGNSGAGKSTLGKLIVGILEPSEGRVLLNGAEIHRYERTTLGPQLGYMPQDVELFSGTVAENIARMADPDPEKVIEAAKLTDCHDLILRMPKGYDSEIGEGGSYLSGGQRQRIALARAVYGYPRLLVLDEPNANLDEAGEQALSVAVRELKRRGSTIFMVSHRRSALELADRVAVMARGRIQLMGDPMSIKRAAEKGLNGLPGESNN